MSFWQRLWTPIRYMEHNGERIPVAYGEVPDWVGPSGAGNVFRGARSALRATLRTSWIQGVSGSQGLAILKHLKNGAMDDVALALESGGDLIMTATKNLTGGGRIDTLRRIAQDGSELSAVRRIFDAAGTLVKETVLK